MNQDQQSRWWPIRRQVLLWTGVLAALTFLIIVIGGYLFGWNRTGFAKQTLWDWLDLLIIPIVLAVGGYLFTMSENSRAQWIIDRRAKEDRQIAHERAQDSAIHAYLDQISQLLVNKGLRNKKHWLDDTRVTARARSLTILRQLDGDRKKCILQYCASYRIINKKKKRLKDEAKEGPEPDATTGYEARIVGLSGVILKDANLRYIELTDAVLDGAILENADLRDSKLKGIDLAGSYLSGADLRDADLRDARLVNADLQRKDDLNLRGATLSGADLSGAKLSYVKLRGTKLKNAYLELVAMIGGESGAYRVCIC